MDLRNQVAFVTGSAGGLGKEFALRILKAGGRVCLSDVKADLGEVTLKEMVERFGPDKVHFLTCDVTSEESLRTAFEKSCRHFGVDQLDLLVNNAGVMGEKEGWRLCMDINLQGVLLGSNIAFSSKMSKLNGGRGGTIVNVASILGLFNAKQPKGWAYNTSKSAVVTFTRCVADNQDGIRMLCLCPSVAKTPILAGCTNDELKDMEKNVGGFMTPEQVGDAFEALVSGGKSGSVMAVWKDCPAYYLPDLGFPIFVFFTTIAMVFRFIPGLGSTKRSIGWKETTFGVLLILLTWMIGTLTIMRLWSGLA